VITAERYHDISCGHRVVGHEGKCQNLHGHNYRIFFTIQSTGENELDQVGRVLDFSVIKSILCAWLEERYDHKMLIWDQDPMLQQLLELDKTICVVAYNPTAENIAWFLVDKLGPLLLEGTGTKLVRCRVEETRKCSATYEAP
jgi:6-pyruvoyltetrahydropterin/6-carboxytetrahydropterin synthase